MGEKNQSLSEKAYKDQLQGQKKEALKNANTLIGGKLNTMDRLANGEHMIKPMNLLTHGTALVYNDPIVQAYQEKAEELTREFERLAQEEDREYLLTRQNIIFSNWQRRLDVILDLNGKDNKEPNLEELRSKGASLIRGISIPQFMADNLREPLRGKYIDQIEARGQELLPDLTGTLERIQKGELTSEDWNLIVKNIEVGIQPNPDWVERDMAMGLVGAIPPHLRTELLARMQSSPNYEQIVLILLAMNYLTVAQVESTLRAQNPKNLEALLAKIQNPSLAQAQEKVAEAQKEGLKRMHSHRPVAHTNSMRQLLTFKGMAGSILALNGMATIATNVLMDVSMAFGEGHDLGDSLSKSLGAVVSLPENKAFWMGVGMTGAGLEMSNGMGGFVDKPSTKLGKWFEDKDAQKEQERRLRQNEFEKEIQRYPRAQELYFNFTEEINRAYEKKRADLHTPVFELTLEEMGIDYDALPNEFKSLPKQDLERHLSDWVRQMAGTGNVKMSIDSQKIFIGEKECRREYGQPPLEAWDAKQKEQYALH